MYKEIIRYIFTAFCLQSLKKKFQGWASAPGPTPLNEPYRVGPSLTNAIPGK